MTSSIPNGFSSEELQSLFDKANVENHDINDLSSEEDTSDLIIELADQVQTQMDKCACLNEVPPQLLGKVVTLFTINRMIDWHSTVGQKHAELGEAEQALGWMRDAGKFQAMANILSSIIVCDEDNFLRENCD